MKLVGERGFEPPTSTVPNDRREKRKYLPFRKLQPPGNFERFDGRSHSVPFVISYVLRIPSTNWPQLLGEPRLRRHPLNLNNIGDLPRAFYKLDAVGLILNRLNVCQPPFLHWFCLSAVAAEA